MMRSNRAPSSQYGALIIDRRGTILGFDRAMETLTGWPAVDDQGKMAQTNRRDTRLVPRAYIGYAWSAESQKDNPWIPEVNVRLDYRYVRQWSNSDWYDTAGHVVAFSVWGSW